MLLLNMLVVVLIVYKTIKFPAAADEEAAVAANVNATEADPDDSCIRESRRRTFYCCLVCFVFRQRVQVLSCSCPLEHFRVQ